MKVQCVLSRVVMESIIHPNVPRLLGCSLLYSHDWMCSWLTLVTLTQTLYHVNRLTMNVNVPSYFNWCQERLVLHVVKLYRPAWLGTKHCNMIYCCAIITKRVYLYYFVFCLSGCIILCVDTIILYLSWSFCPLQLFCATGDMWGKETTDLLVDNMNLQT
jgi:hypothetical protein